MIDFESQAHKCQACKMPPISLHAAGKRPVFMHFVKARLPGCKMHVEQKRLIIEHYGRMWCIGSGNYLVFRDDGKITVMGPSAFRDVYNKVDKDQPLRSDLFHYEKPDKQRPLSCGEVNEMIKESEKATKKARRKYVDS